MAKDKNPEQTFLAEKLASIGINENDLKSFLELEEDDDDLEGEPTEEDEGYSSIVLQSDLIFARLLFPEKDFTEKEISYLEAAVDCAMYIKNSENYKKSSSLLEEQCPGMIKVGRKLLYALNVITYSGRRDLNKNEQKIMDKLMSTEASSKMVKELQIEDLWEDVREGRKNAALRLRNVLEDPVWKNFFINKFISDFSIATAISEALKS